MLWEHERYYGLGVDALVTVCSANTLICLAHGCFGCGCTRSARNAMRGIRIISGRRNTLKVWFVPCGPHPRGRPSMHFLRVYAPAEPTTIMAIVLPERLLGAIQIT